MIKKLILVVAILLIAIPVYSAGINLRFSWDEHPQLADIEKWGLYSSETSGGPYTLQGYIENIPPPGIMTAPWTFQVQDNTDKTYYFVLTAVGFNGLESSPSNEVSKRIDLIPESPPNAPTNFSVMIEIVP